MRLRTLDQLDTSNRRVLVRSDLNVPLSDGRVADDYRIRAALPTIAHLRANGAQVVVCSHLGRPKGRDETLSMRPVGERLSELGGFGVVLADSGDEANSAFSADPGVVVLLENTRFDPGETANDPASAERLAGMADMFVMDAFGTAHRAHASTVGVAELLPSVAGLLVAAEVDAFGHLLDDPPRPFTVVLGGAKVADKLGVLEALLPRVDMMLIGGGMCFTLLEVDGYEVGESLVDDTYSEVIRTLMRSHWGDRIQLPTDVTVAREFSAVSPASVVSIEDIESDHRGMDIGPATSERFAAVIGGSASVFWNGPMGVFEWPPFAKGTENVAKAVAASNAYTVVGGGDSVAALRQFGLDQAVSHLSTGGGAGLTLLEGGSMPGLDVLKESE